MMIRTLLFALFLFSITACTQRTNTTADTEFEKQLRQTLLQAKAGDVIELPEGSYTIHQALVVTGVKHITIKGKGKDKTIIRFTGKKGDPEGFRIAGDGIVLEDFTVLNAGKYGIQILNSFDVTLRRIKATWDVSSPERSGWYGLYPVNCTNVMVEECEVSGARMAGIGVNQSKNIIVRRNSAHGNTIGIAVENSSDIDVTENIVKNNTAGILCVNLPNAAEYGKRCRMFNNKIEDNNLHSIAPPKTVFSEVPSGTGLLLVAARHCETFNNEITNHATAAVAVLSYLTLAQPYTDSAYDPYCGGIYLHDNQIFKGTDSTDNSVRLGKVFREVFGDKVPEIIDDGLISATNKNYDGSIKAEQKICIRNNGDVAIGNILLAKQNNPLSRDKNRYDCANPTWNEVKLLR